MAHENMKQIAHTIAQQYGLAFVILFGSVARGKEREKSDVDIAVLREDRVPLSYVQFSDIAEAFARTLEGTFTKVDLVDLACANILLRYEIAAGGTLLAGNEDVYEAYRRFAFRDYVDSQSLRDLEETLIRKRQAEIHRTLNA